MVAAENGLAEEQGLVRFHHKHPRAPNGGVGQKRQPTECRTAIDHQQATTATVHTFVNVRRRIIISIASHQHHPIKDCGLIGVFADDDVIAVVGSRWIIQINGAAIVAQQIAAQDCALKSRVALAKQRFVARKAAIHRDIILQTE